MESKFKNIRHIILDFGGVIINIDYKKTEEAFVKLGITDFAERYSQMQQTEIFNQLETGKIGRAEFVAAIKELTGNDMSEDKIIDAWNAMLLDIPLRRLQILQQLQLHFDLFLLSNTNEIHEEAFNKILKGVCGFNSMGVFFDKVYFSHRLGMRKPDKEIFQYILDDTGINPEKTLFVDDSPQHIEAAKTLGIQTIYLEKGMTIEDDIFKSKYE
ncbi:HAD family phosphatase [Taibaiella lutea]|uniref:HAD family phosphatase n=1 Tax=Taibaiella lutea TaxID=2608001 RepID=A0A5M6CTW3_9BACT|nr:HAD family phosphatase [Taibaiella lutea]KAA5536609.1 HAD family phosphatase [Taibaiella lutea]